MSNQPVVIKDHFTQEQLDKILYYCYKVEKLSEHTGLTGAFGYATSAEADRLSVENPIAPLTGDSKEDESILAITDAFLSVKTEMEKFFGQEMSFTNCMYAGMPAGTKNPMHYDNHSIYDGRPNHEDEESEWSAIAYLNGSGTDFEGGDIHFPEQGVTISPEPGMIVFFEGSKEYPHEVLEGTSGFRRTLVLFLGKKGHVSDRTLFLDEHSGVPSN